MEFSTDILLKIERFCAYQERCTSDVVTKLKSLQTPDNKIDNYISHLMSENFLNDERYVEVFVRSKIKQSWGKQKIYASLSSKHISKELIDNALENVDNTSYAKNLQLASEKWLRTHQNVSNTKEKLIRHLISKGYSYREIIEYIDF